MKTTTKKDDVYDARQAELREQYGHIDMTEVPEPKDTDHGL